MGMYLFAFGDKRYSRVSDSRQVVLVALIVYMKKRGIAIWKWRYKYSSV